MKTRKSETIPPTALFLYLLSISYLLLIISCKEQINHDNNDSAKLEASAAILKASVLINTKARLGEGALWNHKTQEFYWVDIEKKELHIYNPTEDKDRTYALPSKVGTVVPYQKDKVILALEDGVYTFNTENSALTPYVLIDQAGKNVRFNDGKCDPAGRFWVGTMDNKCESPIGNLYMVREDGTYKTPLDSITISNGIVWNAAKNKMYYIDTPTHQIVSFDYNNTNGQISNRKIAVTIDEKTGSPDGMAIDENNHLWVGLWNGGAVACFDPETGEMIKKVEVPAHNVTACAFTGPKLDILYITTASEDMTEEEQKKYPLAGSVFQVKPGVKGTLNYHFGDKNQSK